MLVWVAQNDNMDRGLAGCVKRDQRLLNEVLVFRANNVLECLQKFGWRGKGNSSKCSAPFQLFALQRAEFQFALKIVALTSLLSKQT